MSHGNHGTFSSTKSNHGKTMRGVSLFLTDLPFFSKELRIIGIVDDGSLVLENRRLQASLHRSIIENRTLYSS